MEDIIEKFRKYLIDEDDLRDLISDEIVKVREVNPAHNSKGQFSSHANAETYSLTANALDNKTLSPDHEAPARGKATKSGKISSKFGMNTGNPDKQCGRLTIKGKKKKKTRSCKDYPSKYEEGLLQEPEAAPTASDADKRQSCSKKTKAQPRKALKIKISPKEGTTKRPISKKRKKDQIFPGYGELQSLSRGIMESVGQDISLDDWIKGFKRLLDVSDARDQKIIAAKMASLGYYRSEDEKLFCSKRGYLSSADWLKLQNNLALSSKGELFKKEK